MGMPKKMRKLENNEALITSHRTPKKERVESKEVKANSNPRKRNAPFRRVIDEDLLSTKIRSTCHTSTNEAPTPKNTDTEPQKISSKWSVKISLEKRIRRSEAAEFTVKLTRT